MSGQVSLKLARQLIVKIYAAIPNYRLFSGRNVGLYCVVEKGILFVLRVFIGLIFFRNVACNRGKEEKANLIDSESLNVHIDYKKVSLSLFNITLFFSFSTSALLMHTRKFIKMELKICREFILFEPTLEIDSPILCLCFNVFYDSNILV